MKGKICLDLPKKGISFSKQIKLKSKTFTIRLNFIIRLNIESELIQMYLIIHSRSTGKYLFKMNNRNSRTGCIICSTFTIKHQNNVTYVVLVSLQLGLNISNLDLGFLLLTLSRYLLTWKSLMFLEFLKSFSL